MSTDPQHKKQNKSMFILLSIISIMVISTLVLASIYFLKPTIETPTQAPLETQVHRTAESPVEQNTPYKSQNQNKQSPANFENNIPPEEVNTTQIERKNEKQNSCAIRFTDNQLLVKNADRK
jgi:flagellar basal body-associated protein FliL